MLVIWQGLQGFNIQSGSEPQFASLVWVSGEKEAEKSPASAGSYFSHDGKRVSGSPDSIGERAEAWESKVQFRSLTTH